MLTEKIASKVKNIYEYSTGVEKIFQERSDKPRLPLLTLPELNDKIWGLRTGLTVVGARTSNCKSAFVIQVALDLANQGKEVVYVSLEQSVAEIIERMFCNQEQVDNITLLKGGYNTNPEIKAKWETFKKMLEELPLLITDGIGYTFQELNHFVEMLNPKPQVLIVDFVQNISQKTNEAREMLNEYIRYFRELCIKNDIAGILCSQANRQSMQHENKEPSLGTLKATGFLEEGADVVLLLHWEWFYNSNDEKKNNFKIIVAKNRNGRTGVHNLFYIPEFYKFEDGIFNKGG